MTSTKSQTLATVQELLQAGVPRVRATLEGMELGARAMNSWRIRPTPAGKLQSLYESRPSWLLNASTSAGERALEGLPEFGQLVTLLETAPELEEEFRSGAYSDAGGWGPPTAKAVVMNVVRLALHASEFEAVDDAVRRAVQILDESMSEDFVMRVVAPLNNLSSDILPIRLDEQFRIDRMSWIDAQTYWSWTQYASVSARDRIEVDAPIALFGKVGLQKFRSPRAAKKDESRRLYELALRLVHLLRLQCPGRLSAPWVQVSFSSPAGGGGAHSYILSPKEEGPGGLNIRHGDDDRLRVLWIACKSAPANVLEALRWFGHSRERYREEDRAIDLVTAAEALFLGDGDPELKHRLSLRAAYYIGTSIEGRLDVFRHIKTAYDVRSALVHGSSTQVKKHLKDKPLIEFSTHTEGMIRSAITRALEAGMPTDWDQVLLGVD